MTDKRYGVIKGINGNMVKAEFSDSVVQNEVAYILHQKERLKSEVIRVRGNVAELQVYEDTKGLMVGEKVEFTGELLSVELGPGLLGQIFDGLQVMAALALRGLASHPCRAGHAASPAVARVQVGVHARSAALDLAGRAITLGVGLLVRFAGTGTHAEHARDGNPTECTHNRKAHQVHFQPPDVLPAKYSLDGGQRLPMVTASCAMRFIGPSGAVGAGGGMHRVCSAHLPA